MFTLSFHWRPVQRLWGIQELLSVQSRDESTDASHASLVSSMQPPSVVPPRTASEAGTAPVFLVHKVGGA